MTVTLCLSCSLNVGVYSIGAFRGPPRSGVAFPTTSGFYCLDVCWQLHRGFPRSPSVGCGLPYHISSLTLWESAGNCLGVFRVPPRSGVAFPTTSGLYCLEVCWQLHRGFPRSPSVRCGLPYHISSLTLWKSAGNCLGVFRVPPRSGVAFTTTSGLYCLEVCWQLPRGFPRSPSVRCGLPYHISSLTLWKSAGNCLGPKLNWVK